MRLLIALALTCLYSFANAAPIAAEHAKISLDVTPGKEETVMAFVDQTPPDHGKNPRPVVKVKAGEPIKLNWMLTNVYNAFPGLFILNI